MSNSIKMLGIILSLSLVGCGTTHTNLDYQVNSPAQANKNISVFVQELEDVRPASARGVIGSVDNTAGMKFGDIKEPENFLGILKQALNGELKNAGYTLTQDSKDISIKAQLESAACLWNGKSCATIRLRFIVNDHGKEVINKVYGGDAAEFAFVGYAFDAALTKSAKNAIGEFIKDLDSYVKS